MLTFPAAGQDSISDARYISASDNTPPPPPPPPPQLSEFQPRDVTAASLSDVISEGLRLLRLGRDGARKGQVRLQCVGMMRHESDDE